MFIDVLEASKSHNFDEERVPSALKSNGKLVVIIIIFKYLQKSLNNIRWNETSNLVERGAIPEFRAISEEFTRISLQFQSEFRLVWKTSV